MLERLRKKEEPLEIQHEGLMQIVSWDSNANKSITLLQLIAQKNPSYLNENGIEKPEIPDEQIRSIDELTKEETRKLVSDRYREGMRGRILAPYGITGDELADSILVGGYPDLVSASKANISYIEGQINEGNFKIVPNKPLVIPEFEF